MNDLVQFLNAIGGVIALGVGGYSAWVLAKIRAEITANRETILKEVDDKYVRQPQLADSSGYPATRRDLELLERQLKNNYDGMMNEIVRLRQHYHDLRNDWGKSTVELKEQIACKADRDEVELKADRDEVARLIDRIIEDRRKSG